MVVNARIRTFLAILSITVLSLHLFHHGILKGKTIRKIVSMQSCCELSCDVIINQNPTANLVSSNVRLPKNLAFYNV